MKKFLVVMALAAVMMLQAVAWASADELVVYTARKEHLVKPLFDAYTKKTGVEIKYVTDKAGALLQRLKAEGTNTPADILITVDAGNLWHAANVGLLEPVKSEVLEANVPSHLRDAEGRWFGLSVRARTIVYSTERLKPSDMSTYEDLATSKWKGRLCLRTSKKVYNQSLVAMLIAEHGIDKTENIVKGWVNNLASKPFSNDTKVMEAIKAGLCDLGVVNTYYFGRLQKKDPDIKLALFWPNQDGSGVHVNISGAGVARNSKNKQAAKKFIEWLSSTEAQAVFAGANMEYPVNRMSKTHPLVKAWGEFKGNVINVTKAGELQTEAIKLMDRAKYK
jgi:iron(III) transport system substrate-binding protein